MESTHSLLALGHLLNIQFSVTAVYRVIITYCLGDDGKGNHLLHLALIYLFSNTFNPLVVESIGAGPIDAEG